ncbi:transposase, partial [Enterococcus faecium]
IKVLKRNAYGFRNFYNFKLRILVQQEQAIQTK